MYYDKSFAGLLELAETFEADADLNMLAGYCRLREQGLRRDALAKLEEFLIVASAFDNVTARQAVIKILEADTRTPDVYQFLAQPLVTRFLTPTLQAWMRDDAHGSPTRSD
ncbi:MAG: hypothetical protein FWF20_02625 [Betaproteobacteria bacterium]|nr:hypothetical protein [Betaproteobacteria bacterium]MCL2885677.1 hypothetical protein [Betaproteobacteria bacterium]